MTSGAAQKEIRPLGSHSQSGFELFPNMLLRESCLAMSLRILHISSWNIPCGIANYCQDFVEALNAYGFENQVAPIDLHQFDAMSPSNLPRWADSFVQSAEGFNLVHIQHEHGFFGYSRGFPFACQAFGLLVQKLTSAGIPSLTTFHSDVQPERLHGLKRRLRRFIKPVSSWQRFVSPHFRNPSGLSHGIVHSKSNYNSFVAQAFSPDALKIASIPCPTPQQFPSDNRVAKSSLGYAADTRLVCIFGFVGQYKGHDLVIQAFKRLPSNFHLAIVGGAHPESTETFLNDLLRSIPRSMRHRIRVTGWVDRQTADQYSAAADLFVAPYRGDTTLVGSGAVTWALCSGKPVIASKVNAFVNINRDADCLFMVSPDCPYELGWAIEKIADDATLQSKLTQNARKYCQSNSWSSFIETTVLPTYSHLGVESQHVGSFQMRRAG